MPYEQRFMDFARLGADWFWETDREDRFTFFSVSTSRTGINVASLIGRRRRDFALSDSENQAQVTVVEEAVAARQPFRDVVIRTALDAGPAPWCATSGEPKYDANGTFDGYRGVGRDVSSIVEMQKSLEIKSRTLEAILRAMPDGVQVIDKANTTLAINDQMFEILDVPKREGLDPADSAFELMRALARRGEYGPGDAETLARERADAMLELISVQRQIDYQRELNAGRWIEARLRAFDDGGMLMLYRDITEDRRLKADLERQLAVQSTIFASVDCAISVVDRNDRLVAWNGRFADMTGTNPDHIFMGTTGRDLIISQAKEGEFGPCDPEAEADRRIALYQVGLRDLKERTRPNGRTIEFHRTPTSDGGLVTLYIDVTERRRIEQELRELNATLEQRVAVRTEALAESERLLRTAEQRYRTMFDASPFPMIALEKDTRRFRAANDAAVRLYGWSREELLTMNSNDLYPPEDLPKIKAMRQNAEIDAATPIRGFRHRKKDGTIIDVEMIMSPIELDGQPGFLATAQDVTERLNIAKARLVAEERLRDAIEGVDHIIMLFDCEIRLAMFNRRALLQYPGTEDLFEIGRKYEDILDGIVQRGLITVPPGQTRQQFVAECLAVLLRADGTVTARQTPDGGVVHYTERRTESGGIVVVGVDVTERLKVEEQLRQSQKMEAVGQLTGGIAHDFNNILMVILATIEALQDEYDLDAPLKEHVDHIDKAAQRATDLTRQMLAFSRKQALRPQHTDVNELVAAIGRLLRRTLGDHIELDSILSDNLWTVNVDRSQLETALVNLCVNARDAMPAGGRLLLETTNAILDEDYVALNSEARAGAYAMIAVTDTGTGIAPDVLGKVFEPFFTTKEVGKGTGLGLSMVYGLIKQSNGHIKVYSEVGQGTTIKIYLPRVDGLHVDTTEKSVVQMPRGNERILVVEDDSQVRASVVQQLESLGYEVDQMADGAAGFAAFETAAEPYDLLLTDVVMPGPLTGKRLATEVVKRWPKTLVIFMSGYTENAIVHNGQLDPGVLLLTKPFRKHDLAQIVRQTLDTQS
jgi:PAS domain S-box-containing protein